MALPPSVSIAVRLVALNGKNTQSNPPAFLENGRERLIERAAALGEGLGHLRQVLELQSTIAFWQQFLDYLRLLLTDVNDAIFVSSQLATARDLCFVFLQEFGFRLRSGIDLAMLRQDQGWNDAVAGDSTSLDAMIRRDFQYGGESLPPISSERLDQLLEIGSGLVAKATDVPFGSLAYAISRTLDRPITLWAFRELQQEGSQKRAIRYTRKTDDGCEEIIFYAPSKNGPSAHDFWTRYEVAHELAHVALRHPPGQGGKNRSEELEAHYLAVVFLLRHGAPRKPEYPEMSELRKILAATELSETERTLIVEHIISVLGLERGEFLGGPAGKVAASTVESRAEIIAALDRYETDQQYREQIDRDVESALAAL